LGTTALILLTPLAVGSVEPWAYAAAEVVIFLLFAIWISRLMLGGSDALEPAVDLRWLLLPAAAFVAMIAFQLVPLPPSLERVVAPSTFELYQKSLPGWPRDSAHEAPDSMPAHSEPEALLLPTAAEVAAGAAVPFNDKVENSARTGPQLRSRSIARWRPLSIDSSITRPALLKVMAYLSLFLMVVFYRCGDASQLQFVRRILQAVLLAGVIVALLALLGRALPNGKALWLFSPYDWGKGEPWGPRATSPFANPDHLASYLDMVLPMALAGLFFPAGIVRRHFTTMRVFCGAAVIVIASALLLTSSRGGWLGALLGLGVLAALWARNRGHQHAVAISAWSVAGFLLLVLLFVGPGGRSQADVRLAETLAHTGLIARTQLARMSLGMVRDFPVFGVGLGCWPGLFPRYSTLPWSPTFWNAAHNDYVQLLCETGLLGFGLLLWFAVVAFRRIWRGVRERGCALSSYVAACFAGICAVATHEFFDFSLQIPANALLFAVLLGLVVRIERMEYSLPQAGHGENSRLILWFGLPASVALIVAAATQKMVPYPYDVTRPATLAEANVLLDAHPADEIIHLMTVSMMNDRVPVARRMQELRAAVWLAPTNPVARDSYAQALLETHQNERALKEISRSVAYAPTLDSHFYLQPRLIPWLSPAEQSAVENGFRVAIVDNDSGAIQNLARFYEALGSFSSEADLYYQAANVAHDSASRAGYLVDSGIEYARAGKLDAAESALRAASAAAPAESEPYEEMVQRVYGPRRNFAAARALVESGIQQGADPIKLYLALASAARSSGDETEAENAVHEALRLRPSNFSALMLMAALDAANGRFDRATTWLLEATRVDPRSPDAFYDLGLAYENAYEYFAADRAYRQALGLAPNDARIKGRYIAFRQKLAQNEGTKPKP
jgi:O-antigen ligase/Flp pilus assembly protein TadD